VTVLEVCSFCAWYITRCSQRCADLCCNLCGCAYILVHSNKLRLINQNFQLHPWSHSTEPAAEKQFTTPHFTKFPHAMCASILACITTQIPTKTAHFTAAPLPPPTTVLTRPVGAVEISRGHTGHESAVRIHPSAGCDVLANLPRVLVAVGALGPRGAVGTAGRGDGAAGGGSQGPIGGRTGGELQAKRICTQTSIQTHFSLFTSDSGIEVRHRVWCLPAGP
jgi:hypothetical protein